MPRKNAAGDQYRILNEAKHYIPILTYGTTEVWYWKNEYMRDLLMGLEWLREHVPGTYPEPYNLSRTHVMVGRVKSKNKADVFMALQGEIWSPNGEARTMIKAMGLGHTSMSVGDILVINGSAWFVDGVGWVDIGHVNKED
jgi:hypothetical protein